MYDIILTAPHGNEICNDVVTKRIALRLQELLTDRGMKVACLINEADRSYIDMNRPRSRDTPWRMYLRTCLKEGATFLLDIHGFPHDTTSDMRGRDMIALRSYPRIQTDLPEAYRNGMSIACERMRQSLITDVVRADRPNDIVHEAMGEFNIPAVLVEHCESGDPNLYAAVHEIVLSIMCGLE